ncbi:hypothetical protein [Sutcliffiella halmapala]|uniref:hypothetical protein n=1 Tax=Sutcliffiella halmapala TaxID=79882 RepID=UPI001474ABC1|nr:hypothetical protein [Sutcliffiella halmapala]
MNRSLRDQLKKWEKQHGEQKRGIKPPTKEKLSDRDLWELMGANGPRYVRKRGGAYTQR